MPNLLELGTLDNATKMEQHALINENNGKQSTVNKSLDGSMYPG
jgi:hypothetical protein